MNLQVLATEEAFVGDPIPDAPEAGAVGYAAQVQGRLKARYPLTVNLKKRDSCGRT